MRMNLWATGLFLLFPWLPLACSAGGDSTDDPGRGGSAGSAGAGASGGSAGSAGASGAGIGGASGAGIGGSSGAGVGGTGGMAGGGGDGGFGATGGIAGEGGAAGASGAAGVGGAGGSGNGPDIPPPRGTCPDFRNGDLQFQPASGGTRTVVVTMGAATNGPLIFYWHATYSQPSQAASALPISQITADGGIIVAPRDVAGAGMFPWLSQQSQHDDLFEEVIACAAQKTQFDRRRIHALGFSAGGLMTGHLSMARSKYLASVATYSGGGGGTPNDANNKFAAMIMHGGSGDSVFGVNFQSTSEQLHTALKSRSHFAMICNHGGGHSIPRALMPRVYDFFKAHPYGTVPSPYAGNIPSGFSGCTE